MTRVIIKSTPNSFKNTNEIISIKIPIMNLIISIISISCYLFGQTLIFELLKLLVPTAILLSVIEILP